MLPRWQQDDRGPRNSSRGHHEYAPAGAYALVRPWNGRVHWITYVVPTALRIHADKLHGIVSSDLLRRYLTVASGWAQDQRTGRRCVVRPDTIASVLGVTKRAVQICRRMARRIGLEVVIRTGRMLTFEEVRRCRRNGSPQRGLSTEVAFTIPSEVASGLGIFTPTRGPSTIRQTHLITHYLSAASGAKNDAAPPRQPPRARQRCREGRGLAVQLLRQVPWLASERPGRLAPTLQRFAVAGWDADGVVLKLREVSTRRGRDYNHLTPESIRTRPAAVLADLLRDLDTEADHPSPPDLEPHDPCTRTDCVHGWIDLADGSAAKCPDCSNWARAGGLDVQSAGETWDPDDPPF